jgi:hypothetical protein
VHAGFAADAFDVVAEGDVEFGEQAKSMTVRIMTSP